MDTNRVHHRATKSRRNARTEAQSVNRDVVFARQWFLIACSFVLLAAVLAHASW